MSDSFYSTVEPVDAFERLALPSSYVPLPGDWWLLAADVVDSTAAVEQGRYKNVNTVGVSVIAAARNVVRPVDVPYVFGGDGALVCVPERFVPALREAMAATIAMARASFELTLRVGIVPVSFVRDQGLDVLVARQRVSSHYVQCALHGGGPAFVEGSLKDGSLPTAFVVEPDAAARADYGGLECRWNEVPSPRDETVAVIIEVPGAPSVVLPVYQRVMERIRGIYGEAEDCRPVRQEGLSVSLTRAVLANESKVLGWRSGPLRRLCAAVVLRAQVVVGWFLLRFGVKQDQVDWGRYKDDLVVNTDFRKFDGCLRLVLTGTREQRAELTRFLNYSAEVGELSYGMHVARSAVMTCLIEEREGAHFHFVDASEGGYASASVSLKRQRSRRAQGLPADPTE
jgi:hypothetical protein